jgi:HEAT repeat protein
MLSDPWSERRALRVSGRSPESPMTERGAKPPDWVDALADPERRQTAFRELAALGPAARAAVQAGLGDGRFEVRRSCVVWLWRHPDPADLAALVPLLRDPKRKVRHAAVVALALAHGRARATEVVPLLVERALHDENLRVRRQAVALLAWELAHPDLEGFFAELCASERDAKLVSYARAGERFCRERAVLRDAERAPC